MLASVVLAGVATAAKDVGTLAGLWQQYLGSNELAPLENARNVPRDLFSSGDPVSVELVQVAAEGKPGERVYDLYMENSGDQDLLLTEVRYGPGVVYMSSGLGRISSGAAKPNAAYRIEAHSPRGTAALSPPYALRARAQGAIRLRLKSRQSQTPSSQTLAFEIFAADGTKLASVNRMLGE